LEIIGVLHFLSPPVRSWLTMIAIPPPWVPAAADAIKGRQRTVGYPAANTQGADVRLNGLRSIGGFSPVTPDAFLLKSATALSLHRADKPMQGLWIR